MAERAALDCYDARTDAVVFLRLAPLACSPTNREQRQPLIYCRGWSRPFLLIFRTRRGIKAIVGRYYSDQPLMRVTASLFVSMLLQRVLKWRELLSRQTLSLSLGSVFFYYSADCGSFL